MMCYQPLSGSCPVCGSEYDKIIHGGLPMKLCKNENCSCIWGFWSWWLNIVPFTGWLIKYESSYWSALWFYLFGDVEGE